MFREQLQRQDEVIRTGMLKQECSNKGNKNKYVHLNRMHKKIYKNKPDENNVEFSISCEFCKQEDRTLGTT